MNSSLITADVGTQMKIVAVALLAGILVVAIGIGTRAHTSAQAGPAISDQASVVRG